jgi:CheY-like chemotaxis protein
MNFVDSSKRAVEAADNVVHAYDLNMEMPETSLPSKSTNVPPLSIAPVAPQTPIADTPMFLLPASSKRDSPDADDCHSGRPRKRMFTITEAEILRRYYPDEAISSCGVCGVVVATDDPKIISPALDRVTPEDTPVIVPATLSPGHRKLVTRTFLRDLMHEALERVHPSKEVHTETELGEMVEITTNDWREEVHDKVVFLSVEASVPEVIIIEEIHLKFALQRILDNAIKFTDNGRIEITVKMARSPQLVEIRVADTGCGIAQEAKSQIFKPHFQEDASIRRSRDGLGLSLFNAKAHVRKSLGGDLTLEHSATEGPTKGSEFLLRIPISTFNLVSLDATLIKTPPNGTFAVADISASLPSPSGPFTIPTNADPGEDKMVPSGPASRPVVARKRINSQLAKQYPLNVLIAEDNDTNRKILIKTLERLGYLTDKVAVAVDGVEAVNHYEACLSKPKQERFDLILMDIWMPNMDGFEASTRILDLAQKNGEAPRIMAVTADITGDCLTKSQKIGMGFLPKPYKALEIEGIIIELFQATGEAACE